VTNLVAGQDLNLRPSGYEGAIFPQKASKSLGSPAACATYVSLRRRPPVVPGELEQATRRGKSGSRVAAKRPEGCHGLKAQRAGEVVRRTGSLENKSLRWRDVIVN